MKVEGNKIKAWIIRNDDPDDDWTTWTLEQIEDCDIDINEVEKTGLNTVDQEI